MKVILLGGGAKARCLDLSLLDDDTEVWDINFIHANSKWVPRIDRMFHIHRFALLEKYGYPTAVDAAWAREHHNVRIITADEWLDGRMARAEIFPREALASAFPRGDYHCNSCDWLIAYALLKGVKTLRLHGFSLEREGIMEQQSAAKCAEYWAGYATGAGMEIVINEDSAMFGIYHTVKSNRLYGYDDCPAWEDRTVDAKDPPYRYDDHNY
jgi:hypothetical protein